jgi:nicotinate-nucleotide pyrophosphorylase (carboxylating)
VQKISQKYIKTIVKQALQEDLRPSGDITTKFLKNRKKQVIAKIISGQNAIIGGLNFAKETYKVVVILKGSALGILKSERVALNFLGLISGVATITNKFVKKVKGKSCKICCTRKTSPNLRLMQKYGVKLGGGVNHRFNLSDEILIKDNHISVDQNICELVKRAIKNKKGKKITVEVDNLSQLKKIIGLKFSRLLFDNMSPKNLRKGVRMSKRFYETEASGGVTLKNVRKIAGTGVERISIGQITHSAQSINFKLDFIS